MQKGGGAWQLTGTCGQASTRRRVVPASLLCPQYLMTWPGAVGHGDLSVTLSSNLQRDCSKLWTLRTWAAHKGRVWAGGLDF